MDRPAAPCDNPNRFLNINPPCGIPQLPPDVAYLRTDPLLAASGQNALWGMPVHPQSQTPFTTRHHGSYRACE